MATENDIVLLYLEDSPVSFARVEEIRPDVKKGWYNITLLMLQVPLQEVTWILKDDYINGEAFFMGGKQMRLERVERPARPSAAPEPGPAPAQGKAPGDLDGQAGKAPGGKVISLADIRRARKEP
jgi:hypothetical protein